MKFTTSKINLLNTLQKVAKAVSLKAPLPVLEGILFEVHNNYLTVTATNLDISIRCTTKINGFRDGSIVLPSRYITEIVRRLPDTQALEVESNNSNVCLRYCIQPAHLDVGYGALAVGGKDPNNQRPTTNDQTGPAGMSEAVIQGFNSSSFPSFPDASNLKPLLSIKVPVLSEALKQVLFTVSSDESRPIFTGVLFQVSSQDDSTTGFLKLVATDTHRLVCKTILSDIYNLTSDAVPTQLDVGYGALDVGGKDPNNQRPTTNDQNIIVPGRNLNELARILNQAEEQDEVEIFLGDSQIFFIIKPNGSSGFQPVVDNLDVGYGALDVGGKDPNNQRPTTNDQQEIYPTIFVSRLIAGQFPSYQQVIPQKFIFSVILKTNELKAAVERAMLFTRENISLVNLRFIGEANLDVGYGALAVEEKDPNNQRPMTNDQTSGRQSSYPTSISKCVISTQTEAGGIKENLTLVREASGRQDTQLDVGYGALAVEEKDPNNQRPMTNDQTGPSCSTCSIYFNAHYLAEALRAIPTEEVYLNITGPLSAMIMHPVASNSDSLPARRSLDDYLSLLLPARYEE